MREPIRKITLAGGQVRYRLVVDAGRGPDGRRRQITRTFDRRKDAAAALAKVRHEVNEGLFVAPSAETLGEYLDGWLPGVIRGRRPATARSYADALRPARARLGARRLQALARADVEGLVDWMLTEGRKRGGPAGTGLGLPSVRATIRLLKLALEDAVADGKTARNAARHVKVPQGIAAEPVAWSAAEASRFLAAAAGDRLHACWRLSLYGLRRGEVCGLMWDDIDLGAARLTVRRARVIAAGEILVSGPKTANAGRTLPMDAGLVAALRSLRTRQAAERLAAGGAYEPSGYVAADELGAPLAPGWYSRRFARLAAAAGVRRIPLHGARHTACSLLEKAGVPVSVISKWAGHHSGAFTMATYVHADGDDLTMGADVLGEIYAAGGHL